MSDTKCRRRPSQVSISKALRLPIPRTLPIGMGPRNEKTGICLSGGGIRSAMFCLGVLQVLQRRDGLLFGGKAHNSNECQEPAHALSVVSGGSYIAGSFAKAALDPDFPANVSNINNEFPLGDATNITNESKYLIKNPGRYIVPVIFNLALLVSLYVLLACPVAFATLGVSKLPEALTTLNGKLEVVALVAALAVVGWALFYGLERVMHLHPSAA